MITITTPNKEYSGITGGVQFVQGKAEVKKLSPATRAYMECAGYVITDDKKSGDKDKDKDKNKSSENPENLKDDENPEK